ncbi:unnamed protein product [Gadus morhua 'NCC']
MEAQEEKELRDRFTKDLPPPGALIAQSLARGVRLGMTGKRRERDDAKEGPKTKGSLSEQRPRNEEEKCAVQLAAAALPGPVARDYGDVFQLGSGLHSEELSRVLIHRL